MPRFAANLSMLYPELDFLDRFEAAAKDGFRAVEFLFPYAWPAAELPSACAATACSRCCSTRRRATGTAVSAAWPAWPGGSRNSAREYPGRWNTPRRWSAPRIHVMAGLLADGMARDQVQAIYIDNLAGLPNRRRGWGATC